MIISSLFVSENWRESRDTEDQCIYGTAYMKCHSFLKCVWILLKMLDSSYNEYIYLPFIVYLIVSIFFPSSLSYIANMRDSH